MNFQLKKSAGVHIFPLIILLTSALGLPLQAQKLHLDSTSTPNRPVYRVVQETPTYPGGMKELKNYLKKNLRYPESARKANLEGRIFVTYIVSEQGAIQNIQLLNGISPDMDAEAVRLVKGMPNWIPAKQDGKVVACRFNLPVLFSLKSSI